MIKNIKVLKNIGVFQNYEMRLSGLEKDFEKNNFIFGLNTYGKSTLCDVFKDANDNSTNRITDRKTIPATTDAQKIVISCEKGTVTLDNNGWKNNCLSNHVLVFDTEFVFNNVFDGTELTEDRATKENFTEFILGKEGVDKIQTIEQLKKSMKANKDQLKLEVPYSQKDCTESEIKKYVKKSVITSEEIEKLKTEIVKLTDEKELLSKRKGKLSDIQSFSSVTSIEDVLGFYPKGEKTYDDTTLRSNVGLAQSGSKTVEEAKKDPEKWKIYRYFTEKAPMATEYDDDGSIKKDKNGRSLKGIEDYLESGQYDCPEHRKAVVENILNNFDSIAHGENGTLFHSILATTSIPEAYAYWKLFREMKPELHVTALFDANVDTNSGSEFEKEKALIEIVDNYSKTFGLDINWKSDPKCVRFKEDLMSRLSHSNPYNRIGSDHSKCLDIVIVVNQLLTGFDSQYVNVLYLDQVLENDNLIQAISRTNRVYDNNEKPLGLVKFFRKIYTMRKNLDEALKLYCQGDYSDVQVADLDENIVALNNIFKNISDIFAVDHIPNFEQLPKSDENRQKFRKEFYKLKSTLRAAMLQGLKWDNSFGKKLSLDEKTYRILTKRYEDLPSNGGSKGGGKRKPGYAMPTNLSTIEMDKIDADYLESQFKIVTFKDISEQEEQLVRQAKAIEEIKKNIGTLPAIKQKYAIQVLDDIKSGLLIVEEGKSFLTYIQEYSYRNVKQAIEQFAAKFGIDSEAFFDLYVNTTNAKVDTLKLEAIEKTADMGKAKAFFKTTNALSVKGKLHNELKSYIEEQKAESSD